MPFDGTEYTGDPILTVIDRVDRLICDEEHWWRGGSEGRPSERHCPRSALNSQIFSASNRDAVCKASTYVNRALALLAPQYGDAVAAFNDNPCRTFADIQALIRKARELRLTDIMETVTV